ncbi:Eukaryotic translation initiation factor 2A [Pycnococcus provasolii]
MSSSAPCCLYAATPGGLAFSAAPSSNLCTPAAAFSAPLSCASMRLAAAAPTMATLHKDGVHIHTSTPPVPAPGPPVIIPLEGVSHFDISPSGKYVTTLQKPEACSGEGARALCIWDVSTGDKPRLCLALAHRKNEKGGVQSMWPALQFSSDEKCVVRLATNEVQVFVTDLQDPMAAAPLRRVRVENIASGAVSPAKDTLMVAAYVPEIKGAPASVRVYNVQLSDDQLVNHTATPVEATPEPIARRSFFRCSSVKLMWTPVTGEGCLVVAESSVDATNQSYYGEQKLHYLSHDGSIDQQVELLKEGPIHDVQWSPIGRDFIVVHGFMPAKTVLFDAKCKPIFDFGSGAYNMVRYNPFGRFIALCGFGNLPGDVTFYDRKADGKCKKIGGDAGTVRISNAVSAAWAPDGRHIIFATTTPRLRVDNRIRVYTYYGAQVGQEDYKELLEAGFTNVAPGTFPDLPMNHDEISKRKAEGATGGAGATGGGGSPAPYRPPSARAAAYRPPGMRGAPGAEAPAPARFSLARDDSDKGGKLIGGGAARPGQGGTGAGGGGGGGGGSDGAVGGFVEGMSKSAKKNAARRAKAAAKAKEEGSG